MNQFKVRIIAMVLGAICFLAIPGIAMAGTPGNDTTDQTDTTTQQLPAPDANDPAVDDPTLEPPAVLDDPAGEAPSGDLVPPVNTPLDQPEDNNAPPAQELSRFSDDQRAPEWQQRDNWRQRGLFYHRGRGWFQFSHQRWFCFVVGRWIVCAAPLNLRPDVVRPVPVADPSPNNENTSPVTDAVNQINPPQMNQFPQQGDRRQAALRRALRVCQVRYVISVRILRQLRQNGRISFRQYIRGINRALDRRQDCRRFVFRAFRNNRAPGNFPG